MKIAAPTAPQVEHWPESTPALGLGTATPRLSWTVPYADPEYRQSTYEVEVRRGTGTRRFLVESFDQVLVPWPGKPLVSREAAFLRVRVSHSGVWSDWSPESVLEAGLLTVEDWSAGFITPVALGGRRMPAPVLSGVLDVPGDVIKARLYATAHGVYAIRLNDCAVGKSVLAPGWTSYRHRLRYQTYDVTALVRTGSNTIHATLGNGWYRGRLGRPGQEAFYGNRLAFLARLEVTTADGRVHVLGTDESWTAFESEIIADDLYDGQRTDLRRRGKDWSPATSPVERVDAGLRRLVAPDGPEIRITEVRRAQRVWRAPSGATLVDFGQNVVGWVRLSTRKLPRGHEVAVRHAEVLEREELGVRPLRTALAMDTYFAAGAGEEILEPSFTYHGFRYAEIRGIDSLSADDVQAVVIGSDLRRTGWFTSSNELLNRLHENVIWSMRGNFVDLPTDCPQRDERLGWTGDIQVFTPTAAFLYDVSGFLTSWLADLAAEQAPNGSVPLVVPDVLTTPTSAVAAWGDAATLVPWALYQRTGDRDLLRRQLPSMRAWVDRVTGLAGPDRLWAGGFQLGDWLDPTAPPEDPGRAKAATDVVATAHFAHSAEVLSKAASELGEDDAAAKYAVLAEEARSAFDRAYVTPTGHIQSDAQTVYALAIVWDLLRTPEQRAAAGHRLADLVRGTGFRIATGFIGTPLVADALTMTGHADVAHRLLLQTGCPSWLYPVTMGATTIWERWDSMLPDGSINPGEMTSFNHFAFGAVADWLHRRVAGLAPSAPGYRQILVEPVPPAALSSASASHSTPYGEASVDWQREGGRIRVRVKVPVGATALVRLPGGKGHIEVRHGQHEWEVCEPVSFLSAGPPTVRDVMDDAALWAAVVDTCTDLLAAGGEAEVAGRLANDLDAPASTMASLIVPTFRGNPELARRLEGLVGPATAIRRE